MIDINKITDICEKLGCRITPECSLSEYVTFRFGGKCRALISVNSADSVAEILRYLKEENIKYFILGRGSNIIVPDEGFDGVVLLFGSDFAGIEVSGNTIKCDAGAIACICLCTRPAVRTCRHGKSFRHSGDNRRSFIYECRSIWE